MTTQRLTQQVNFILEIDRLKTILRRTRLIGEDRHENSAEHSWHIAVMAIVLAEYANEPIDLLRVLKMVLVHDVVEIDAGDTFAYDVQGVNDQPQREQRAASRLFGLLPADQAQEFLGLWHEFTAQVTPEAKFANAMDRLMPLLHNFYTEGYTWQNHGVTKDRVIDRLSPIGAGSVTLWDFAQTLIDEAVAQGILAPVPDAKPAGGSEGQ